jgi:hypothetical protein
MTFSPCLRRRPLLAAAAIACGGGQINSHCAIQAIGEASQGRSI